MSKAILFSGGLDSTCAALLNPDAVLIRVAVGSRYDAIEHQHAEAVATAIGRTVVHVDGVIDLGRYERDDAIVPARNAMIVLAAAQHARELELVSVSGDGTHATDKDDEFAQLMTLLVEKLFGTGRVTVPYRNVSKTRLVQYAAHRHNADFRRALPHVFSCYNPTDKGHHCGACKACVRLYGAIAWAGYEGHGGEMPTFARLP